MQGFEAQFLHICNITLLRCHVFFIVFNGRLLRLYQFVRGCLGIFEVERSYYDDIGHITTGKIVLVRSVLNVT